MATKAAVLTQVRCGCLRAAWAVCPRVSSGSGDAVLTDNAVCHSLCGAQKNGDQPVVIFRLVRTSVSVPCMFLMPFTPLYTRVCVV